MGPNRSPVHSFCCDFINLNHAALVNVPLNKDSSSLDLDIIGLNEPYYYGYVNSKITSFSTKYRIVYHVVEPRSAILIVNIDIKISSILAKRDIVIVSAELNKEKYIIISIYCPPSTNIEEYINEFEFYINRFLKDKIIILGDFNPNYGVKVNWIVEDLKLLISLINTT